MNAPRCVEADPRPGDLVRVIPAVPLSPAPSPIRVTAVDARWVHWQRGEQRCQTSRKFWSGVRFRGGSRLRLELIEGTP